MYAVWLVATLCSAHGLRQAPTKQVVENSEDVAAGNMSIDEYFGINDGPYPENSLLNDTGLFMNLTSTNLTNRSSDQLAWTCPVINPDREVWTRTGERVFAQKTVVKERTYLFVIVPPFWGSTAVLSLLSSSPEVSTLCGGGVWACEGVRMLGLENFDRNWKAWSPDWPNYKRAVNVWEKHWDMSKNFLVEKSPPNIQNFARIARELSSVGKKAAFLIMTRSPCHFEKKKVTGDRNYKEFATFLRREKSNLPKGAKVHQFTYEALLQNPYEVSREILNFFPGLKSLDPNVNRLVLSKRSDRSKSVVKYVKKYAPFKPDRPIVQPYLLDFAKEIGYSLYNI